MRRPSEPPSGVSRPDDFARTADDAYVVGEQQADGPSDRRPLPPALRPIEFARWIWRQLTSMRTALVLLFLLALASIPGSLIPQTRISPSEVAAFKQRHPDLVTVFDRLGLFSVYSSVWFGAIYLLLMISLLGCIVPRARVYVRAARARPPKAPRRLDRLGAFETWTTDEPASEVATRARRLLKSSATTSRRVRRRRRPGGRGREGLSARGGQPRVPPGRPGRSGRRRCDRPLRLQGASRGDHRRLLPERARELRRLHARQPVRHRRPRSVHSDRRRLPRVVGAIRRRPRHADGTSTPTSPSPITPAASRTTTTSASTTRSTSTARPCS